MNQEADKINVAVVGVGRMGTHHARTYAKLAGANLLAVVDADLARARQVAEQFGCEAVASVDELLARYPKLQGVTVAVPTVLHVQAAKPLLARGIACLVEKPLAATAADAASLVELAKQSGAVLQVGHTERFNPAIQALATLDITPRFMEVQRISPMTFRSLDIGVVMDMMIHDLDIVLWLSRSTPAQIDATGVAVIGKHEDVASVRIGFANGCVANLTASRLAMKTERKLRIFSPEAYISVDYQAKSGIVIRKSGHEATLKGLRERIERGDDLSKLDYAGLIQMESLEGLLPEAEQDPLTAELSSFMEAIRHRTRPVVSGEDGLAAVQAAERIVARIAEAAEPNQTPRF